MNLITELYYQWRRASEARRLRRLEYEAFRAYMTAHDVLVKNELGHAWHGIRKANNLRSDMNE